MVKTVFALALLAMSGTALAYQEQPAPDGQTAEAVASVEKVDADAAAPTADAGEANATADEDQLSDKENYRAAVKALSKCRQNARRDNTPAAAAAACNSQRKRMLAAKEALRTAK